MFKREHVIDCQHNHTHFEVSSAIGKERGWIETTKPALRPRPPVSSEVRISGATKYTPMCATAFPGFGAKSTKALIPTFIQSGALV